MNRGNNTDLLRTLRNLASGAATVLDLFVKLGQDEPRKTEAPPPAPPPDAPFEAGQAEPAAPVACIVCGDPHDGYTVAAPRGRICEPCILESARALQRQQQRDATKPLADAVCLRLGELDELSTAALDGDGLRTLPLLGAELSRLIHDYRERTGPFAQQPEHFANDEHMRSPRA